MHWFYFLFINVSYKLTGDCQHFCVLAPECGCPVHDREEWLDMAQTKANILQVLAVIVVIAGLVILFRLTTLGKINPISASLIAISCLFTIAMLLKQ